MRRMWFAVLSALLFALFLRPVEAHTTLRDFIQHRAAITVGSRNIDVSLELTFYEDCSVKERRRMDADGDGRVEDAEVAAYLAREAGRFAEALSLGIDGRPLELLPLFDPQIDLQGDSRVTPHFHVLRLDYFVRTPEWGGAASVLELKDGLWAGEKALRSLEVEGKDGVRAAVLSADATGASRVRCEAPRGKR